MCLNNYGGRWRGLAAARYSSEVEGGVVLIFLCLPGTGGVYSVGGGGIRETEVGANSEGLK